MEKEKSHYLLNSFVGRPGNDGKSESFQRGLNEEDELLHEIFQVTSDKLVSSK